VIRNLRTTVYSPYATSSVTTGGSAKTNGSKKADVFSTEALVLRGRIQTVVMKTMSSGMALGKKTQKQALRAAETETGRAGRSHAGKGKRKGGSGRDDTQAMINSVATNVEIERGTTFTSYVGWHGWVTGRKDYFEYQEHGTLGKGGDSKAQAKSDGSVFRQKNTPKKKTPGSTKKSRGSVPAANSLGKSIPTVREYLRSELSKLL